MSIPTRSEFQALVPVDPTNATGAELRRILIGDGTNESLSELMARWMEAWFTETGDITGDLEAALCDLDCVTAIPPSLAPPEPIFDPPTVTVTVPPPPPTPHPAPAQIPEPTPPEPQKQLPSRTFTSANVNDPGSQITWSGLDSGTYVIKWVSGYYRRIRGTFSTLYGTIHSVTDGTSPFGLPSKGTLMVATLQGALDEGFEWTGRGYKISQGGSISIRIGWSGTGDYRVHALTYQLTKTS